MTQVPLAGETSADRARRYRRMADQTRDLAWRSARPELREAFLDLAMHWVVLADDARRGRWVAANDA